MMIYLDNAATTKVLPEVLDAMMPYLTTNYGNAGSLHKLGREASSAIETARQQVADFLNCQPENIIFTSGGSEANNLAIKGVATYLLSKGKTGIATSAVEHDSVFNALRDLKRGFYPITIPVNRGCICDSIALEDSLRAMSNSSSPIGLVSVMYANNITGAINNVEKLASIAHNKGAMFHTDCVQAAGFNELDVKKIGCDFLSLSGHKIHAPKGVGALYVKDRSKLSPLISGGSAQEFGLRGGTENVAGIDPLKKLGEQDFWHLTKEGYEGKNYAAFTANYDRYVPGQVNACVPPEVATIIENGIKNLFDNYCRNAADWVDSLAKIEEQCNQLWGQLE